MEMKCANCGAEIAAEDKFCYACGAEVIHEEPVAEPAVRRCPSCGAEVTDDDRFCDSCGADLSAKAPPAPKAKSAPKHDDPSTHPLATLIGYLHNGFGILGIGALILILGASEVPFGDLPEDMAWLLLPVMWFLQPLGWLAALLPGLYLVTRRNATAKFNGKVLIGLGFLVIVLAFYLIAVLAFADIGID
jgi:DNA-directed RNA polymerase subunit RPC12/RpoP